MIIREKDMLLKKELKSKKLNQDKQSWKENGLSNIKESYEIKDKKNNDNITHYKVKLLIQDLDL